jgi:fructoselysine-6-P-deglycase FrlB-like protein
MSPTNARFDPQAPLAAAPDPWRAADQPSLRGGPPYHMTDMIAAEPHLARRLLRRLADPAGSAAKLASAIREAAADGRPIVVTGCGTSEHGAIGVTEILGGALRRIGHSRAGAVIAAQAFELALDPPSGALVIGVSHEGGTPATNRALEAARATGSTVALITVTGRSPGGRAADLVIETGELDTSWCHTIGYVSPLLAAAAVAAHIDTGWPLDPDSVAELMAAGSADPAAAEGIAARIAARSHLLVIASGADRAAGRELVLKVEEAAWLPSAFRDLETFLHGHLPATGESTGLVLVLTDPAARADREARARGALAAARAAGVDAAAILAADAAQAIEPALTPAGRIVVPEAAQLPPAVASLLGSATPLQLITERIARARGTNPDPIRRDEPRYHAAAEAAESDEG